MTDIATLPTLTSEEVHAKMRQIRNAKSRIAEEIATCEIDRAKLRAELELVDEHQERVTKDDREYVARLERELQAHLLNLRAADDRVKSVKTPWGDILSRELQPEYIKDDAALLAWCQDSIAGFVRERVIYTPDWERLKKACHVNANGQMVTDYGEIVAGVEVIERGPKVTVEVVP